MYGLEFLGATLVLIRWSEALNVPVVDNRVYMCIQLFHLKEFNR